MKKLKPHVGVGAAPMPRQGLIRTMNKWSGILLLIIMGLVLFLAGMETGRHLERQRPVAAKNPDF